MKMTLVQAFERELGGSKRIMFDCFPAAIGTVMNRHRLQLTQETINAFLEAVESVCFGGIEPEWPNEQVYAFWQAMCQPNSVEMFVMMTQEQRYGPEGLSSMNNREEWAKYPRFGGKCPYKDKTIPYISWSQEIDAKFDRDGEWFAIRSYAFDCGYAEEYYP